ncbi:hypothetical protein E6C50_02080 [Flavobacterium supellecticarium]|uniref:Uncharacterized protein n=1 Tax=Flavobacterium supellecticarium TaxID=2565924 RepID=A0A4S4A3K3_9FLAO|nr:hypothetical protein [Flavobacterium supellecticarium]THF53019.1 hypothetical protein E6C50_02080 [Flavobacterium supellecticarium]
MNESQSTSESKFTPWQSLTDYRLETLELIITGLENSITYLESKMDEHSWYDGGWFIDESEAIYGLAFIAFQNYINYTISDFYGNEIKDKTERLSNFYNLSLKENQTQSHISLIIATANFYKHQNESLHGSTANLLAAFNITELNNIDNSPLAHAVQILSPNGKLMDIIQTLTEWRKELSEFYIQSKSKMN